MAHSGLSHFQFAPVSKLIDLTQLADYEGVAKKIRSWPGLIFSGGAIEYAAQVYDMHMLDLFEKAVKEYSPDMMPTFEARVKKQTDHFNYADFEAKYTEYHQAFHDSIEKRLTPDGEFNVKLTKKEFDSRWASLIGLAQRDILPRHMLREFTRPRPEFLKPDEFSFADTTPPTDCKAYNKQLEATQDLLPFEDNRGLGYDYALMRTLRNLVISTALGEQDVGYQLRETMADLNFFKALYKQRKQAFEKRFHPAALQFLLEHPPMREEELDGAYAENFADDPVRRVNTFFDAMAKLPLGAFVYIVNAGQSPIGYPDRVYGSHHWKFHVVPSLIANDRADLLEWLQRNDQFDMYADNIDYQEGLTRHGFCSAIFIACNKGKIELLQELYAKKIIKRRPGEFAGEIYVSPTTMPLSNFLIYGSNEMIDYLGAFYDGFNHAERIQMLGYLFSPLAPAYETKAIYLLNRAYSDAYNAGELSPAMAATYRELADKFNLLSPPVRERSSSLNWARQYKPASTATSEADMQKGAEPPRLTD